MKDIVTTNTVPCVLQDPIFAFNFTKLNSDHCCAELQQHANKRSQQQKTVQQL